MIITTILTVRNEEKHIIECLKSISAFELPSDIQLEILVVDGLSIDSTPLLVNNYKLIDSRIQILYNHSLTQTVGFNLGIHFSKGDYILWLGAHSVYPSNYLYELYKTTKRLNADYTGGVINTICANNSYVASLVQALTTHKFGVGNSGFRTGSLVEGFSDTASYGIFNKRIFNKIGYLDERLIRAQDYEFNKRIIKSGGTIWLNPKMVVDYYNQPNLLLFLKKQIKLEAPYNAYMWYLAPYSFAYRHAITAVFASGIIGGVLLSTFSPFIKITFLSVIGFYFVLAFISAIQQAKRYKKILHIFTLPISFFLYHFLHGLGVLWGLLRLITKTAPVQKIKEPWYGYGSYRINPNKKL